jgi:D-tyrosyl-tRNA(Tyr) deacylase
MDELETDLAPLYREFMLEPAEWALIKWLDLMELSLFGLEELKMGNSYAKTVVTNGLTWLLAAPSPNERCTTLLYECCVEATKHGVTELALPDNTEGSGI